MPIVNWQPEFGVKEFKHPELVEQRAYDGLCEVRRQFGKPLILTDDGRLPDDHPTGASDTSLHPKGRAFDLRIRDFSKEDLWRLVAAVVNVGNWWARGDKAGVELELVWSPTDKHLHLGFFLGDGRANRLELSIE